ncbi:dihydroneopterin aldolase [Virgibacillus subterraneus]|uniref:7,8-dihydroneopterin aldolase n=2 Tax=Virgibacillus TaxID=84406 RepID=A0A1H0XMH6_9BACI|nr:MULTISPECIES: dihydroneopterin aldolase [Virgibacillus]SDQ04150.1 dihydroneopterin aldolase [Virgibacillus salinus]SEQ98141.1 dihydroneopterin aldolase [Virgibacillus subterraneus]
MDKILINQMAFYGYHGLFPEENKLGQRFYVDVQLMLNLKKSSKSDDMNDSINYGDVYELVKGIMEGKPKNLIEAVAEDIAKDLFHEFNLLKACTVKVTKPDPPIPGHYQSVAVEITRERAE